jgi:hypothetical protein
LAWSTSVFPFCTIFWSRQYQLDNEVNNL